MARTARHQDWKKFSVAMAETLGYAGEHLSGWAKMWMDEAVEDALAQIDADWEGETHWKRKSGKVSSFGGDHFHPWYTGNLHDSVAGFVTDKNRVVGKIHYMPQAATQPQTYSGPAGKFDHIIGREWAVREANNARYYFLRGIQAKMVVGVPYAREVNESPRHSGYIDELMTQFAANVEDYFTIRAGEYRTRVFVADKRKK